MVQEAHAGRRCSPPGTVKKSLGLTNEEQAALETVQSYLERVRRYRGKVKEELAVLEGWDP